MTMAPRNVGTLAPAMAPIVAMAPDHGRRGTSLSLVHHLAAGVADEQRQEVGDHRPDDAVPAAVPVAELADESVAVDVGVEPQLLTDQGRSNRS